MGQVLNHSGTKVEEVTSGQCGTWAFVATKRGFVNWSVVCVLVPPCVCVLVCVSVCLRVHICYRVCLCVCVYMSSCVSVNCGMWMCCSTSNWVDLGPLDTAIDAPWSHSRIQKPKPFNVIMKALKETSVEVLLSSSSMYHSYMEYRKGHDITMSTTLSKEDH